MNGAGRLRAGLIRVAGGSAVPLLAGSFAFLLGAFILSGWFLQNPSIVKPFWSATYTAFNSALSFVFAGAACVLAAKRFRVASRSLAALAALVALATLIFRLFGYDLSMGIAGWLHLSVSYPVHMGPVAAFGVLAATIVLLFGAFPSTGGRAQESLMAEAALSGTAVTPFILGLIALTSSFLRLIELNPWAHRFAAMSSVSALGLISLGVACLHFVLAGSQPATKSGRRLALPSAAIVAIALVTWAQFDSVLATLQQRENRTQAVHLLVETENAASVLDLNVAQAEFLRAQSLTGRVPPEEAAAAAAKIAEASKALAAMVSGTPLEARVKAMQPELDAGMALLRPGSANAPAASINRKIALDASELHRAIADLTQAVRQANPVTEAVLRQNLIASWLVCAGVIAVSLIALFLELRKRLNAEGILRVNEMNLREKVERATEQLRAEAAEKQRIHLRLAESELRLRSTFEQAAVGLAHLSPQGRFIRVNLKMCLITGYSYEELAEKDFGDITHPEDFEADLDRARALLRGEFAICSTEKRYIHRDGYIVWVRLTKSVVWKPDGEPEYFIAVAEDITLRKAAEQRLRDSESRFRWVVESSPVGIVQTSRPGDILAANQAFYALLDWTPQEFAARGMNLRTITPDDWMEHSDANINQCIESGKARVYEKEYFKRDGSRVPVMIGLSFEGGLTSEAVAFVLDLSELKRTEKLLRASEQHFRMLVESAPSAVIMASADGCIRLVNAQTEKVFGYPREEMIGHPVEMLLPGRFRGGHAAHREGFLKAPESRPMGAGRDLFGVRKDGSEVPVEIALNPIPMAEGKFVLATVVDITERKMAERALRESVRQLELLADAMPQIVWTSGPDGSLEYCNRRWYEYTGCPEGASLETSNRFIHPDDQEATSRTWRVAVESHLPCELQLRIWDRQARLWRWHLCRGLPIFDAAGKLFKWIGTSTDIDDHKRLSEELELRVELRTADLKRSLVEKELLLKEVHHRVKNNLQIVCSLLSMQIDSAESGPAETAALLVAPIMEAHHRVWSMAMIHEHLYQSSETLGDIGFGRYVESLATYLFQAYCVDPARIGLELSVEPVRLTIDQAIPCGLILNEMVTNSLKHAFRDGRRGAVRIAFRRLAPGRVELAVADTGVGLPQDFDVARVRSLGLQVVRSLTDQLGANLRITTGVGTRMAFDWRLSENVETAPDPEPAATIH